MLKFYLNIQKWVIDRPKIDFILTFIGDAILISILNMTARLSLILAEWIKTFFVVRKEGHTNDYINISLIDVLSIILDFTTIIALIIICIFSLLKVFKVMLKANRLHLFDFKCPVCVNSNVPIEGAQND